MQACLEPMEPMLLSIGVQRRHQLMRMGLSSIKSTNIKWITNLVLVGQHTFVLLNPSWDQSHLLIHLTRETASPYKRNNLASIPF